MTGSLHVGVHALWVYEGPLILNAHALYVTTLQTTGIQAV